MNYAVLCDSAKAAYDLFYEAVTHLHPIKVNMKTKKIIFDGDVYSFESRDFFNKYVKPTFQGETMESDYFYYVTDDSIGC